ncbi:hypothetical protein GCM10010873_26770 [Cypionkella aquatica]|uniref:Uncharacterized protein n=1 Tax=Cypionkella aquatica TaxID=1756042 RepID=A0AA37TU98_9RHOB|nr:hypothetical protein [Cypionkella aquatica]GLS87703.1 hypothetical protein GCM10010873_26770 [Cypionkella aquatica]
MKSRGEIGVLFEATAVAQETITDALSGDRARKLVQRLEAAGAEYADVLACARAILRDLPTRRRDDEHMVSLARALRAAIATVLRPAPVGLDRRDIYG